MNPYDHKPVHHSGATRRTIPLVPQVGLGSRSGGLQTTKKAIAAAKAPARSIIKAIGGVPAAEMAKRDVRRAHFAGLAAKSHDLRVNPAPARTDLSTGRAVYQNAFTKSTFVQPFQYSAHTGIGHAI